MPEILIKSRITAPALAKGIIHRSRLMNLLKKNIDKSLLLICTSAGFGKTTLANDFLSQNIVKHAWYYATPDINSLYAFFTYIIHSIKNLSPAFGNNSLELVQSIQKDSVLSKNYKSAIDDCVATLSNEFIDHFKDDTFLVIDDLHNIDSKKNSGWLNYFFDVLFENLPPNLHLFITTRDIPEFNISILKAKRRIFKLESNDLIFDNEEINELLEREYSIHSTDEDIYVLQSSMHGWITGIHLVLQAYGKEFRNLMTKHEKNYTDIFNYFAKDIFDSLNDSLKEFLLNTAILENFNTEICNNLLNIDYSEKMIGELVSKNIFIELAGTEKITKENYMNHYNYQELFRFFLLSKLHEIKTKEEIIKQFSKLYQYYLNSNEVILAVNYGLKAEDYSSVTPLIIEIYKTLFDKGNYDILWEWVDQIPGDIIKTNPHLLYLRGLLDLYYLSDPEKSLKYLNDALSLASEKEDISLIVNCNILKTDTLLLLGKIEYVKDDLRTLLLLNITGEEKARLLYQISRLLYREGRQKYNEMIDLLNEALDICNEQNIQSIKAELLTMLANVYSDWGDLVKSIHYYELALNIKTDVYKMFKAMNNIIRRHCITGNYVKAKEYLERNNAFCNSFPSLYFKRFFLRSKGELGFEIGDYEECIRTYDELNNLEIKNNITQYAGQHFMTIGLAYYYLKKYDTAYRNYEFALNYIDKSYEYHLLVNSYFNAQVSVKVNLQKDAEKIFLDLLKFAEKNNILYDIVNIEFLLAEFYLKSGSRETALKYLKNCLKVSEEKQYISFLEQEALNTPELFDLALANNIHKQFIKTIFENVRGKLQYDWLSVKCKIRLKDELEKLNDLKLISFGKTEILLRGKPIEEEKWVRKKSKIILAYLLTKPDMLLTKDKIIDMFFQDVPLDNLDTIFHNTISNIRSAVRIGSSDDKGKKKTKDSDFPLFIIYENKNLSLNTDYHYESDCLQFEKLFNIANSASSGSKEKTEASVKAIELYKGEFMPGYYDPWCEELRENYLNMYQKLCENLVNLYYESGDHQNIIKYSEKLLEADKLIPIAYLRIIESYVKLNNINTAKSKFASMLRVYEDELGEKPEKQVLDKINSLLDSF